MRITATFAFMVCLFVGASTLAQPGGASALAELNASPVTAPADEVLDAGTPSADASLPDVEVQAEATPDTGTPEAEPTVGEIAKGAGEVYDVWKSQGWIAGLAALIYLLVQVTKVGFIKTWLGVKKWLRPLIALVLGLAGAVLASIAGGVVWWNALIGGLAAAFSSSGFNELMNSVTPSGRDKRTG